MADGSDVLGFATADAAVEKVGEIVVNDSGVKARIFTYEAHPCGGLPGSSLP